MEYWKHVQRAHTDSGSTLVSVSPPVVSSYTNVTNVPYYVRFMLVEKTSVKTPEYFTKLNRGLRLPVNPFLYRKSRLDGDLTYVRKTSSYINPTIGTLNQFESRVIPFNYYFGYGEMQVATDYSEAELQLLKKLKGETWQAGVALLEARKTADMVTLSAQRLVLGMKALRSGHLGTFAKTLGFPISNRRVKTFSKAYGQNPKDAAANAWLEYQYGWRPLVQDVHNAFQALQRHHVRPESYVHTCRVMVNRSGTLFENNRAFSVSPYGAGELYVHWSTVYRMSVSFSAEEAASTLQSFDLMNPASTVWEAIPFSFVADWFLPIGDYLSVLDAHIGKTFVRGSRSVRHKEAHEYIVKQFEPANQTVGGGFYANHVMVSRDPLFGFPSVSFPGLSLKPSIEKMYSALALLNNQAKKFGRG